MIIMTINDIYSLVQPFLMLMGQLLQRRQMLLQPKPNAYQTTHSYGCPACTQPTSPRDPP